MLPVPTDDELVAEQIGLVECPPAFKPVLTAL
jgi:hypothetical protein